MKISKIKFIFSLTILLLGLSFIPQMVSAQVISLQPYASVCGRAASDYSWLPESSTYGPTNFDSAGRYNEASWQNLYYDSNGNLPISYFYTSTNLMTSPYAELKNTLTYDTVTRTISFNYTGVYGQSGPYTRPPVTDDNKYAGAIYWGIWPSGYRIGDITATKGQSGTFNVTFSGSWTAPNFINSSRQSQSYEIYKNCPGIFIAMSVQDYFGYGYVHYWQFDANPIITQNLSYSPPVTIVNGKAFSITLPNANGKFVGINSIYGTLTGTVSGSSTILSGTLTGVPSSYTSLNIGSNTIQIRGVAPPSTSTASVSFY